MSVRKHRVVGILRAQFTQFCQQCGHARQPYSFDCIANGDRIAQVVDVFAGAGKVSQLEQVVAAKFGQFATDEIFDCLDIVFGRGLGCGQGGHIFIAEIGDDCAEFGHGCVVDRGVGVQQVAVGQMNQPFDFNLDSSAVEAGF